MVRAFVLSGFLISPIPLLNYPEPAYFRPTGPSIQMISEARSPVIPDTVIPSSKS